jgi:hypothetical protein
MLQCIVRALLLAWLSKPVRGKFLSGPLVWVTQYEPTSQMRRAPGGPLYFLRREISHVRQAASSKDETRESKEHDSSRTLFGFRFPVPLRNNFDHSLPERVGFGSRQ